MSNLPLSYLLHLLLHNPRQLLSLLGDRMSAYTHFELRGCIIKLYVAEFRVALGLLRAGEAVSLEDVLNNSRIDNIIGLSWFPL